MTLIEKAEAVTLLHEIADDFADPHVRGAAIAVAHIFTERADALPARGVGVLDKTLIAKKANDAREVFSGTCDTAKQAIDYLEQLILAALAPTDAVRCAECDCDDGNCTWIKDAAHVNETPKSEHDAGNVLTDAAQAREAALAVLAGLSSYLGVGLGDDDTTAEQYDKRIRWAIDDLTARIRQAALRAAAAAVRARYTGDNNREDMEVLRCEAAILALIEETRT